MSLPQCNCNAPAAVTMSCNFPFFLSFFEVCRPHIPMPTPPHNSDTPVLPTLHVNAHPFMQWHHTSATSPCNGDVLVLLHACRLNISVPLPAVMVQCSNKLFKCFVVL